MKIFIVGDGKMDARCIFEDTNSSLVYMERYVNDGSPSGWTKLRSTSNETSPFFGRDSFPLLFFSDADLEYEAIGKQNPLLGPNINYVHPDSIQSTILQEANRTLLTSEVLVAPTSGGRTMFILKPEVRGFLKLTYDIGRIGRVDRQLTLNHCLSSYEVSETIKKCIDAGQYPESFALLLESSGKVSHLTCKSGIYEWGTMFRELVPYPYVFEKRQIVPGFSLFGKDHYNKESINDEVLINQFIDLSGSSPIDYLLNVLKITVDAWFNTLLNCSFILETHGQNCYYEINQNFQITRIVIKDMDSVDKDISLAKKLGLNTEWKSYPFACFYESEPENVPWYYKIRPSYMYDFKLGTYILDPLIESVCCKFNLNRQMFSNRIKQYVNEKYMDAIPNGYFPENGCWYYCNNDERKPGERRKYYSHPNPKYR